MRAPQISIVVPLFNESESFPFLIERLGKLMDECKDSVEVVLVNDGSHDNTGSLIRQVALLDERYQGVLLARHYGHQIALSAGIEKATGSRAIMVIDADLQDPPEMLFPFYEEIKKGADVVYGVGQIRKDEGWFKRNSSFLFYRVLRTISQINIPYDSADFCMISRRVADILKKIPEKEKFMRGLRAWVGLNQVGLPYVREQRVAGKTKYSLKKMVKLAMNGLLGFSDFPVKLISFLGAASLVGSFVYLLIITLTNISFNTNTFLLLFLSGIQLLAMSLLGAYLLRIFNQVNGRPTYIIEEHIFTEEKQYSTNDKS